MKRTVSKYKRVAVMLMLTCFVASGNAGNLTPQGMTASPLLAFWAISDVHIHWNTASHDKFRAVLQDLHAVAPGADALIINGDITSAGTDWEYDRFNEVLSQVPHAPAYMTMGNHEFYKAWHNAQGAWDANNFPNGETEEMSITRFLEKTASPSLYYDAWIGGYHFIFLGSEQYRQSDPKNGEDAYLSEVQLNWLEQTLGDQAQRERPIFVFLHQPLPYTVSGSSIPGNNRGVVQHERLTEILAKYPQVMFFSGHTHWTLDMPTTVVRDRFTMVNSASSWDPWSALDRTIGPNESEGLFVEVYADRVVVKGRDFYRRVWMAGQEHVIALVPLPDLIDYDFGDSASKDSSKARHDGIAVGNPQVRHDATFGKNALFLDGVSYVRIPDQALLRPKMLTLAASFSLAGLDGVQAIVSKNQNSDYGLEYNGASRRLEAWLYVKGSAGTDGYVVVQTPPLEAQRRYDVAVTYDGSDVILYLDGVRVDAKFAPGELGQAAQPVDLAIGADPEYNGTARSFFRGQIGYVRIYSFALTELQITGVSRTQDQVAPVWPQGSSLRSVQASQTSIDVAWSPATDNVGVIKYRIYVDGSAYATVDSSASSLRVTGLEPETVYTVAVEASDAAGNWSFGPSAQVATTARVYETVGLPDLLDLEFADSATQDVSPAANHGRVIGNVARIIDQQSGRHAAQFDGQSSYITIRDNPGLRPETITLVAAFSLDSLTTTQGIVSKNQSSDYGLEFNPSTGTVEAWTWIHDGRGGGYVILQTPKLTLNTVYHVVMTYDGHENALYVNGLKVDSKQVSGSISRMQTVDLAIGADPEVVGARSFLKGKVFRVQIYSEALTPGQVQTVYDKFIDG